MGAVWGGVGQGLSTGAEFAWLGAAGFLIWLASNWELFNNTEIPFPQFISE